MPTHDTETRWHQHNYRDGLSVIFPHEICQALRAVSSVPQVTEPTHTNKED